MPNRMLRDWTNSDKINSLDAQAERFFTRLIMKADDFGCFYADTRLLKANLFPLLLDGVREADISRWMAACQKAGLIVLYEVNNKSYLQIVDFGQRLDKARSNFPLPVGNEIRTGGFVYLMHSEKEDLTKIGYSLNPWARLKEVQRICKDVVLTMMFKGTMDEERIIHQLLREYNYDGEWFKLPKDITSLLSKSYDNKKQAVDVIVDIRSNRSPAEVEVEPEFEPEQKPKKKPKPDRETEPVDFKKIIYPFGSENFLKNWENWKEYKSAEHRFKFKSPQSEQASLKELVNLAHGHEDQAIEVIQQSMANGWKGLFELKNQKNENSKSRSKSSPGKVSGEQLNEAFTKFYSKG